jgi:hypothetical protein
MEETILHSSRLHVVLLQGQSQGIGPHHIPSFVLRLIDFVRQDTAPVGKIDMRGATVRTAGKITGKVRVFFSPNLNSLLTLPFALLSKTRLRSAQPSERTTSSPVLVSSSASPALCAQLGAYPPRSGVSDADTDKDREDWMLAAHAASGVSICTSLIVPASYKWFIM